MNSRVEEGLILAAFTGLLVLGLRFSVQVGLGPTAGAPTDFLAIEQYFRAFAWALVGFALIGVCVALAILTGRAWGYSG